MPPLESIRFDPIMDVGERAGRGRAFYEIFPGTAISDEWLLDFERPDAGGVPLGADRQADARSAGTSGGVRHDHERKAA